MKVFIIKKHSNGNAAVEFVWSVILFVIVFLFLFQIFQVTYRSSRGLIMAKNRAFNQKILPPGFVTADQARSNYRDAYARDIPDLENCETDCDAKLNFRVLGSEVDYDYGIGSFQYQVDQHFILYLPDNTNF